MSEWVSRVESHPIQNTLSNYESKISEIENEGLVKSEGIDDFERVKKIIRLLKNNLTQDPLLLTPAPLNNLNNNLQNSLNELTNFKSNQNIFKECQYTFRFTFNSFIANKFSKLIFNF